MCDNCLHQEVCKYRETFEKLSVKIPASIEDIVKVDIACKLFKDERYYKVIRPMGTEV